MCTAAVMNMVQIYKSAGWCHINQDVLLLMHLSVSTSSADYCVVSECQKDSCVFVNQMLLMSDMKSIKNFIFFLLFNCTDNVNKTIIGQSNHTDEVYNFSFRLCLKDGVIGFFVYEMTSLPIN